MNPRELKRTRLDSGLTQEELARKLQTTRMTITRYETGTRRIPGVVEVVLRQLSSTPILPLVGMVAAGRPIEPIPQAETVDVPPSMTRRGENFGLRIKGESMRDEGILPGDVVIVRKQASARNGQHRPNQLSAASSCRDCGSNDGGVPPYHQLEPSGQLARRDGFVERIRLLLAGQMVPFARSCSFRPKRTILRHPYLN
jgi:hypothetical protein